MTFFSVYESDILGITVVLMPIYCLFAYVFFVHSLVLICFIFNLCLYGIIKHASFDFVLSSGAVCERGLLHCMLTSPGGRCVLVFLFS